MGNNGFQTGSLHRLIAGRTRSALASGALIPIETETQLVEDSGIRFPVRVAINLARKEAAGNFPVAAETVSNPFLPYEEALFVASVSETHVALLNKYNVLLEHLLIVTRIFEPQDSVLTSGDFRAWCRCLAEFDSLGFYNSGPLAGASQSHKHLQAVSLPLSSESAKIPILPLIDSAALPFRHFLARFDSEDPGTPETWAAAAESHYKTGLRDLGIGIGIGDDHILRGAFNLLLTRDWILIVPRSRERFESISINGLGFAGSFFVKNAAEIDLIRNTGPLKVLEAVSSSESNPVGSLT